MADKKITTYNSHNSPTTNDKFFMVGSSEEYLIDYDALASAILDKLTSKTYSGLNNSTVISALQATSYSTVLSASTYNDKAAALAALDTYATGFGGSVRIVGYISTANSSLLGLSNTSHYFDFYVNSANYRLLVARPVNGNTIYQLAKQGGTWGTTWTQMVNQASIDTVNANITALSNSSLSYDISKYTSITSGTDLNTLTTYGQYRSSTASVTNSLSNCPITGFGFILNVYPTGTNLFLCQEIYTTSSTTASGTIVSYRRFVNARDSLYGAWQSVETAIGTNASNIAANTADIATNTANIATNTSNISTLNTSLTALTGKVVKTTLSTTQTYANATAETYNYQAISGLSDYAIVLVNVNCANLRQTLTFVNGDTDPQYLYEINGNNKIRGGYSVDWTNNRVRVRYLSAAGSYTYQNVYFSKVVGFIKL